MSEQALVDYSCPYANTYPDKPFSKFMKEGRKCKISGELCFNWYKYEAVKECQVRKDHDKKLRRSQENE